MRKQSRSERSTRRRVGAAARRLPPQRRAIFLAVCAEEESYAVIARRFGLDAARVEQEFAAALVDLAAALDSPTSW